ncbi:MAG: hypothetical protein CVU94_02935 [Firmicutes bacterium HGW-Firmicutes-19]|nr:MAG: hypothetical protein CVU94_02935 [Firmicutes bacterium HGW-Firmicutes-19]
MKRFLPDFDLDKFEYIDGIVEWLSHRKDPKAFISPENMAEKKVIVEAIVNGFIFNEFHNQPFDVIPHCQYNGQKHGEFGHFYNLEPIVEIMEADEKHVQEVLDKFHCEFYDVNTYADQLMLYSRCSRYDIMDRIRDRKVFGADITGIDYALAHVLLVYKYEMAWVLHELINIFEIAGMGSYVEYFAHFMKSNPFLDLRK